MLPFLGDHFFRMQELCVIILKYFIQVEGRVNADKRMYPSISSEKQKRLPAAKH